MQKVTINLSESSTNILDRANHATGVIAQAMVATGMLTITSDNDPAAESGVARIIELILSGATKKYRLTASNLTTTWIVTLTLRNNANTANINGSYQITTLVNTNTSSAIAYIFHDIKTILFMGYAGTVLAACKSKSTTWIYLTSGYYTANYIDADDTAYAFMSNAHYFCNTLAADSATSILVAHPSLLTSALKSLYVSGNHFLFDANYWVGTDKFSATAKQAIEISTGNYLVVLYGGAHYVGYIE